MKYETKKKIRKFIKAKWKWMLGSGIFLAVGLTVMMIGFQVSGWSLIKWLQSPFATTTLVFVVIGAILFVFAFVIKKNADYIANK